MKKILFVIISTLVFFNLVAQAEVFVNPMIEEAKILASSNADVVCQVLTGIEESKATFVVVEKLEIPFETKNVKVENMYEVHLKKPHFLSMTRRDDGLEFYYKKCITKISCN